MRQVTRVQIVELLIDLASPIGPEVFAGFGSTLQNERYARQRSREGLDGILEEEAYVEQVLRGWASDLDPAQTLSLLFDIACNGPGSERGESLRERRRSDWEHRLVQLIAAVGSRDPTSLRDLVDAHRHRVELTSILEDISERVEDAAG